MLRLPEAPEELETGHNSADFSDVGEQAMSSDDLWFMTAYLKIHLPKAANVAGVSLIEHRMAEGFAVPLHVHHDEDESFYILDGEFRFQVGDNVLTVSAGQALHVPGGVVHSFRVISPEARFLTITPGRFEAMVRTASRPAPAPILPPQKVPTPEEQDALVALCAAHGIEFVGPSVQ